MNGSTSPHWQSLLPAAMVGTEKMALGVPALSGDVGALLAQLHAQADSPARALLQTASVLAVCERAARQGQKRPMPASLHAAAPDVTPALSAHNPTLTLRWALADAPVRLQIELLQRLKAAGLRLPVNLLPAALEAGQRSVALRPALLAVLGGRGRWLARQNTAWRYATGTAEQAPLETRWSEGSLTQRVELLKGERQSDPASARERLQAVLPGLPAKERAELAAVLIEGLSMADESLLVSLFKDRGGEVRQTARALLVQLPASAATQRAIARLQPCLQKPSTLKSLLGAKWLIDAPQAAADDWKADGLEAERPKHDSLGERAWWLYQLARQVPLAWWTGHTGMAPAALVQWAAKGDWNEALARAWLDVLRIAPHAVWCKAFLDHWPAKGLRESPAAVLALLPPDQREPYWTHMLQDVSAVKVTGFSDVATQMVQACAPGESVSQPLSALLLEKLPLYLSKSYLHVPLDELCCVLHPSLLPTLLNPDALARLSPPPPEDSKTQSLAHVLRNSLQVIAARHAFFNLSNAALPEENRP